MVLGILRARVKYTYEDDKNNKESPLFEREWCYLKKHCSDYLTFLICFLPIVVFTLNGLLHELIYIAVACFMLILVEIQFAEKMDSYEIQKLYQREMSILGGNDIVPSNVSMARMILKIEKMVNDNRIIKQVGALISMISPFLPLLNGKISSDVSLQVNVLLLFNAIVALFVVLLMIKDVERINDIEDIIRDTAQQDYIELQNKNTQI